MTSSTARLAGFAPARSTSTHVVTSTDGDGDAACVAARGASTADELVTPNVRGPDAALAPEPSPRAVGSVAAPSKLGWFAVRVAQLAVLVATMFVSASAFGQPDPDPWALPGGSSAGSATGGSATGSGATGSGATGSGATGSGATGSGTGSGATGGGGSGSAGSGSGKRIIQLPTDINAPQVSAAASPTVVRLGGKFTLFITATFGEGVEVNLPEPVDLGPAFEVRRKVSEDRDVGDGRKTREWQLEVTPWELGDIGIAPINVTYTYLGKRGQVPTNVVRLRIEGVLGDVVDDPKAVRANHGPQMLDSTDWFWLWVVASAVGAGVAVATFAMLRGRKRKHTVRLVAGVTSMPRKLDLTSEQALERLLAIAKSGALDRDDDRKGGYQKMVEVIREYLGARYHVATLDLTSIELLRKLDKVAPEDERALIQTWLERCDIVKYGGFRASAAEAHGTLDDARALVVTTTQLAAAKKAAAAAAAPPPAPDKPPAKPPEPPEDKEAA